MQGNPKPGGDAGAVRKSGRPMFATESPRRLAPEKSGPHAGNFFRRKFLDRSIVQLSDFGAKRLRCDLRGDAGLQTTCWTGLRVYRGCLGSRSHFFPRVQFTSSERWSYMHSVRQKISDENHLDLNVRRPVWAKPVVRVRRAKR